MPTLQQSRSSRAAKQTVPHTLSGKSVFPTAMTSGGKKEAGGEQTPKQETGRGPRPPAPLSPHSHPRRTCTRWRGWKVCVSLALQHRGHGAHWSHCSVSPTRGPGDSKGDWENHDGQTGRTDSHGATPGGWGPSAGVHARPTPPANSMRHANSRRSASPRGGGASEAEGTCGPLTVALGRKVPERLACQSPGSHSCTDS